MRGARGFTLIEVLVCLMILSFIIGGIYGVLNVGNITYYTDLGQLDLQQQARQAMNRIVREVRQTNDNPGEGELNLVSASEITFYLPPATYDPDWAGRTGPIRYYLDTAQNRVIREFPAGTQMILANDISSLQFSLNSGILRIQLGAAKTVRQRPVSFSLAEKVRLRNE